MNINTLLKRIKKRLGIFYFKLPIDDQDLIDVIHEDSLVTFSTYYPYYLVLPFDTSERNKVPGSTYYNEGYFINTNLLEKDMKILSVVDVNYSTNLYGVRDQLVFGVSDYMSTIAALNVEAVSNIPIVPRFQPPNKVYFDEPIRQYYKDYSILLAVTHNKSLASIPPAYEDEFFKLALIDIKIFLYNNLKQFDQIDTTFGQISLKIDDWNNADDDRANLISKWDETYIASNPLKMINC